MTEINASEDVARKELHDTLKKGEKDYLEGRFSIWEEVSERIDKTIEQHRKWLDNECRKLRGQIYENEDA